jgi:hypothetical protein
MALDFNLNRLREPTRERFEAAFEIAEHAATNAAVPANGSQAFNGSRADIHNV